jgi:hypothetical protein
MQACVAILGAGGKMGARALEKLGPGGYRLLLCEADPRKADELRGRGFQVTPAEQAASEADFVLMAVPDALIGVIARGLIPLLKPGAVLIMLDAAAAYLGEVPSRADVTAMIVHPCHPPFFTEQATPEARRDYFGGVAWQDLVVSLIEGEEERFQQAVSLCRQVFAPVREVHRVSPEQFALLEPAMSEIIVAAAAAWMKEALEEAVRRGVPRAAAEAFMAGHAQIALAIVFGAEKSPFSDAAQRAIEWGARHYIAPNWREIFEPEILRPAIQEILGAPVSADAPAGAAAERTG